MLLIGDLAEQAGVAPSALRYYEAAGLLEVEARTESGYRVYGERAADRLRFIQRAKSVGLKLSEIKRLIDSPRATREAERAFFQAVMAAKLKETQSTITGLQATARQLRGLQSTLDAQPPPDRCHLGDCACWLPA
jgi:DNA-binding transcriptional MerR regulator